MLKILFSVLTTLSMQPLTHADTYENVFFGTNIDEKTTKELGKLYSPKIVGRTLYIKGIIGGHIYDFMAYEDKNIREQVDVIDLNSLGGSAEYALEIAQKIAGYKKKTKISSGSYCASACVVLFSAGITKEMADDTWLGVHSARLGAGFLTKYWGLCFIEMDDGDQYMPTKKGCKEVVQYGYDLAFDMTNRIFDFMEKSWRFARLAKNLFCTSR